MSNYTICPRIIELAGKNKNYFLDILLPFVQNNSKKICLDKKGDLVKEYKKRISGNKELSDWYDWMSYREKSNFSTIDMGKTYSKLDELLINLANESFDKKLIVESRNHYSKFKQFFEKNKIDLIDKDLAILEINLGRVEIKRLKTNSNYDIETPEDVYKIVKKISVLFRKLVEKNGGYKLLYKDGGRVNEKILQALYFLFLFLSVKLTTLKLHRNAILVLGLWILIFQKDLLLM